MNNLFNKFTKITTTALMVVSTVFSSMTPVLVHAQINYDGNAIIKEAEKHIGKGYVWGATGPNAFDCSGFTQYVFNQVGYAIPRTAEQQKQFMKANSSALPKHDTSQWNPGDLIFYGNGSEAEHVAIYAGNGQVIDCLGSQVSTSPGVTKHRFDNIIDKNGHAYTIQGVYKVAEPKGALRLQKFDDNGKLLEGAVFELKNKKTGKAIKETTNKKGEILFRNLEKGTYTLKEVKAPNGYILDDTVKTIVINGGEEPSKNVVSFINNKVKGEIVLTKYNHNKSKVIPGTTYEVRYPNGKLETLVTGKDGKIKLENLTDFGTYTFTEKKAAPGFIIDTKPIYVELKYKGDKTAVVLEEVEHINYEPTGELILKKQDAGTGDKPQGEATLEGAEYELRAAENIYDASKQIIYKKDSLVAKRTSKADGSMESIRGLYMGKYTLKETKAPNGYTLDKKTYTVEFTKDDETKQIKKYMTVYDDVITGNVQIHKTTNKSGTVEPLEFIRFTLTDKNNVVLEETTDSEGNAYFNDLPYGKYTLKELASEDNAGLVLLEPKEIVIDGSKEVYSYDILNEATSMLFHKVDAETKAPLKGASLAVIDLDSDVSGAIVDAWISDGNPHEIKGLIEGHKYRLTETKAPTGYEVAKYIDFVAKNGGSVTMEDARKYEKTDVNFSKKDITTKEELPGAHLQIKEFETNKVVDSWISTTTPHKVTLQKGKKYVLEETIAPDGYVQAEMIVFIAGEKQTVTMYDDYTKVQIDKVDENGNHVVGAKLQLTKEDGTIIDTWTSKKEPKTFKRLSRGFYILKELEAPNGYLKADDVRFEVLNDASLIKVKMVDITETIEKVDIDFSKKDITTQKELSGAKLEIREKDTNKLIDSWVSNGSEHRVKLVKGKTYILKETSSPDGYLVAEQIEFVADKNKTVTMYDDYTKIVISKKDLTTKEELPGAKLTLKDSAGNIVDSWVSTNEAHQINRLKPGKYTLVEETAPDGYLIAESITFEVKATGEIQTVTMYDDYTKIVISKKDLTTKEELPGAKLTLKDSAGNIVDSWISTNEAHKINRLKPGKYTLIEEIAPKGYLVAESITFEVKANGEIQTVTMYDKAKEIVNTGVSNNSTNSRNIAGVGVLLAGLALLLNKRKNNK